MKTIQSKGMTISNPFHALRHKNFRYYWLGMCVSMTGTWMQMIAQPWLAYKLTNSPFLLSLIGAMQFTPVLLFSLFAGVLVDKFPKKNLLIFTQSAALVITLILAILVFTGQIRYWQLLITATSLGLVNTIDMPTRQSFIIELVGQEDLMNGIALNSAIFNVARIIGPAIGGIIMGYWGVAVCFLANSISYGAVLISLIFIKPVYQEKAPEIKEHVIPKIKEGLQYIFSRDVLIITLMILAVVATFAMNFGVLVPVFTIEVLHLEETGFGFLMSMMGFGSLCGALLVAMTSRSGPRKLILYFVPLVVGISLILVGLTNLYVLTGLALAATGFFFIIFSSIANSTMQLNSLNEYRGRVMSVYSLIFAGSTPLGNLFAGAVSEHFGGKIGFIASGAVIILLMIPIYLFLSWRNKKKHDEMVDKALSEIRES